MVRSNVCVVQARLGSTRLPGKVLLELCNIPMIVHIVRRLERVTAIDRVIVATGEIDSNDELREVCAKYQIECYSGSEDDVLDRVYNAVSYLRPQNVLRVTGDCPLIDPAIVKELIDFYNSNDFDHCGVATGAGVSGKKEIKKYPDGMDCEIMSFESLEDAWLNAVEESEREHVTPYLWKRPGQFKIGALYSKEDFSDYRLTVDNAEDFKLINWIYERLFLKNNSFSLKDIIQEINNFPEAKKINVKYLGKEGYEII